MLDILIAIIGLLLVSFSLYDFVLTTLLPSQEGPLTAFVNHYIFQFLFIAAGRDGRNPVLRFAGLAIILTILLSWVILLWLGASLVFISDQYSVLNGRNMLPTDMWEKVYYTGYTLSTLGIGDYVAGNDGWRVLTSATAFVGLITTTMSITFLVPVISNAGQKRTLCRQIQSLGGSPEQIVINSFDGKDFSSIGSHLTAISPMIFTYAQNQLTYPVLHHMHNHKPEENITLKLVSLDEALTIFLLHIPEDKRPNFLDLYMARRAISSYLDTMTYMGTSRQKPPLPDLDYITRETDVDLYNLEEEPMNRFYSKLEKRRRLWKMNLQRDGWQWNDMRTHEDENEYDLNFSNINYHARVGH